MRTLSILLSLAVVLGMAASASAQIWTSNSAGNWTDASNWDGAGAAPGNGNDGEVALFAWPGKGSGNVTLDSDLSANYVKVVRGGHDSGGFNTTFTITANGALRVAQVSGEGGDFCPAYGQDQVFNMAGSVNAYAFGSQAVADLTANMTGSSLIEIMHTDETTGGVLNKGAFYMQTGDVITLSDTAKIQWLGDHVDFLTGDAGDYVDAGIIVAGSGFTLQVDYDTTRTGWTTIQAVPEPATVALLGLGSVVLLRRRRG